VPKVFIIALTGYFTGLCGFLPGILLSKGINRRGKRVQGPLMGFTGGLLLAFICFEMLPEAFLGASLYIGVAGMLFGVLACAFFEKRMPSAVAFLSGKKTASSSRETSRFLRTGLLLAVGVALHNVPEGMAVGALLNVSFNAGVRMALIIAVHCLPEAVAVALPLFQSGFSLRWACGLSFLFALPLAAGASCGAFLSGVSPVFVSVCLGFAGGVMLYVTCGEVIPDAKGIWRGRLTTVLAAFGFIAGVLLTAKI
jgi:ZIP family zinc transporter